MGTTQIPDLAKGRRIDVGEVKLHVVTEGQGAPVILLHGFPEFHYTWRHQMRALAERGFQAIAPDQRGYYLSDKPKGVASYATSKLVGDVIGLADALGLERFRLVGHDWGGGVAWLVAAFHPERVERLAILNAPHVRLYRRNLDLEQAMRSWYMFFFQLPWLPERRFGTPDALARAILGSTRNKSAFPPEVLAPLQQAWTMPGVATSAIHWYRAAVRYPPRRIPKIRSKTLVLWSERDAFLSPRLLNGIEHVCEDYRIVHLPDASHWVNQEEPERVNEHLIPFLVDPV